VLRIVHRVIASFLLSQAGLKRTGANAVSVTLIQRFGSSANLNIHLHCLVLDGVYRRTEGQPIFDAARAPTSDELASLLDRIIARLMKMLTRAGHLVEEQGMTYLADADADADNPLATLQAASCTYRIALGPRAGQKVLSLRTGDSRDEKITHGLCADAHGISLHAAVRCGADQRKQLERLCRYITRSDLSNGRFRNRPPTALGSAPAIARDDKRSFDLGSELGRVTRTLRPLASTSINGRAGRRVDIE